MSDTSEGELWMMVKLKAVGARGYKKGFSITKIYVMEVL
jgi:hypothetical protein